MWIFERVDEFVFSCWNLLYDQKKINCLECVFFVFGIGEIYDLIGFCGCGLLLFIYYLFVVYGCS